MAETDAAILNCVADYEVTSLCQNIQLIARLRAEVERLRGHLASAQYTLTMQAREVERLQSELATASEMIEAARNLDAPGFKFASHYRDLHDALARLDAASGPRPE